MASNSETKIHKGIPVIYVSGTNYEVGFAVGRTFKYFFEDFVQNSEYLNKDLLPIYERPDGEGVKVYTKCLEMCTKTYPNYIDEIKGMSDGSKVPFYKLFLLNIDFLPSTIFNNDSEYRGCTSLLCNGDNHQYLMAHNEDCELALVNNLFIVDAQILNEKGEVVEKFSTITYPGSLFGGTVGYTDKGMVHSNNTILPEKNNPDGIPSLFIARAMLSCDNMLDVLKILKAAPYGVTVGFSLNIYFAKTGEMYNLEIGPPDNTDLHGDRDRESVIDIYKVEKGQNYAHCNRILRDKIPEVGGGLTNHSSNHRHAAMQKLPKPNSFENFKTILGDQSDKEYPIYRPYTGLVGIFDLKKKTWSLFTQNPTKSKPVAELNMKF